MFKLTREGQEARHLKKEWAGLHPELPVWTKKQQNTHTPGQGGNISICQTVGCQAQVGQGALLLLKERFLASTGQGKERTYNQHDGRMKPVSARRGGVATAGSPQRSDGPPTGPGV